MQKKLKQNIQHNDFDSTNSSNVSLNNTKGNIISNYKTESKNTTMII